MSIANIRASDYECCTNLTEPGSPDSASFSLYEQFLRRELPRRVRRELESRIEERLNPIEEGLRGELVEIVRDLQLQLFEMYKSATASQSRTVELEADQTLLPPFLPGAGEVGENTTSAEAIATRQEQEPLEVEEEQALDVIATSGQYDVVFDLGPLEAFHAPPYIDPDNLVRLDGFGGLVWDFSTTNAASGSYDPNVNATLWGIDDSGYGSLDGGPSGNEWASWDKNGNGEPTRQP